MSRPTEELDAAARYLRAARGILERLGDQKDAVETAAGWTADAIRNGGLLFVGGTGHSHMIAEEVFYRAGGLTAVHPILEPSLMLDRGAIKSTRIERLHHLGRIMIDDAGVTESDVLVVASNSGRNAVPVDMALRGREIGCKVVAIVSMAHSAAVESRHESGRKLVDVADLVLDNGVGYGDAAVTIDGLVAAVGPVSTIAGVALMNAIMARVAELLVAAGQEPRVFSSANLAVESPADAGVLQQARARIRAL